MATKKTNMFLKKKDIQKQLKDNIIDSVATAGGAIGAGMGLKIAQDKFTKGIGKTIFGKFGGVTVAAVGTGLNVTAANPYLKSFGRGMIGAGAIQTVLDNTKFGSKLSMSKPALHGIGATPQELPEVIDDWDYLQGIGADDTDIDALVAAAAQEVEQETNPQPVVKKTETEDIEGIGAQPQQVEITELF